MNISPYTPGQVAREIYGRDKILEDFKRDLAFQISEPHLIGRIEVYSGPRGVGKTSLLRSAQSYSVSKGFETVWVTAGEGSLLNSLIESLSVLTRSWKGELGDKLYELLESVRIQIGGISVGGVSGEEAEITAPSRLLQEILTAAGQAAVQRGNGLIVFIDEIQAADAESLKAVAYAWQHLQSEAPNLPMAVFSAGLSHAQDVITDAVSFAERFSYQHLGNLSGRDSMEALQRPAADKGVRWDEEALEMALDSANGYPYFIQVIGDETWRSSGYPGAGTTIEAEQVRAALEGFNAMRNSFFRARWQKATPAEMSFLQAMAAEGDEPVKRASIAHAMGKQSDGLGVARRALLDKGLIDTAGHGFVQFSAPGFARFIREEIDPGMDSGF
ncbi:ATP-binding protein [Corynebacterium appendicis]|uniref:ATP-binding protein n=1 Tax=Corynebacterium appendicis TaxID=163202 RepID=UPI00254BDE87|nr:ATP-binding protein [Corynebacterium appendicis]MDK8626066.1 ATP-binding protein [Corynebacterium appendicis]